MIALQHSFGSFNGDLNLKKEKGSNLAMWIMEKDYY